MAYLRDRSEERTGYQQNGSWSESIDFQNDFVMVYGTGDDVNARIRSFAEKGYVTHLMTGIAWGEYQDYLYGKFDGRPHFDEGQRDRHGNEISHGKDVPYMVPTIAFCDYLTEKLKAAIDSGVEAIHLEEPEFWDHAGYSEAFRREYQLYYRQPFSPAHESLEAAYKAARLKSYLYARAIDRIFSALKEYAMVRHNRAVRFYVPTHSLINYTQWKIISPEGTLIDMAPIDGFIAQIWTGTSRTPNVYRGVKRERTFETAYLEYGVMQELVAGTGRRMWFLHDPIEDMPTYDWNDYEYNYRQTLIASLLHPGVSHYEICPWPRRVFDGRYPRDPQTHRPAADAQPIPPRYATVLNNVFNALGDQDWADCRFEGFTEGVGVLMSDTALFQRTYPDAVCTPEDLSAEDLALLQETAGACDAVDTTNDGNNPTPAAGTRHASPDATGEPAAFRDPRKRNAFASSILMPDFYGLTLPLLKAGLPIRPVLLDNLRRQPGYLDGYRVLVLSYEFLKPQSPDIHGALAAWVRDGGTLLYVGNGEDPYHQVPSWWNRPGAKTYAEPALHLFEQLGLGDRSVESLHNTILPVGRGLFAYLRTRPLDFCLTERASDGWRDFVRTVLDRTGLSWTYTSHLVLRRGPYVVCAGMDETEASAPKRLEGRFMNLLSPDLALAESVTVQPGENAWLLDLARVTAPVAILGSTCRILAGECRSRSGEILSLTDVSGTDASAALDLSELKVTTKGPEGLQSHLRLKLPQAPSAVAATVDCREVWDAATGTLLLSYAAQAVPVTMTVCLG